MNASSKPSYAFTAFGEIDDAYDQGVPGIGIFATAVQCWSMCQDREVTVAAAAEAFRAPPELVAEAVRDHPWMLLVPEPRAVLDEPDWSSVLIEHDGE